MIVVGFVAAGPISAQTAEIVRAADGSVAAPWSAREYCLGTPQRCWQAVANVATGEIAILAEIPRPGFKATGRGKEITRDASTRQSEVKAPRTDNVAMSASGAVAPPWKKLSCVGREGPCPTTIVNTQTLEIAIYDGKVSPSFQASGNGSEIVRKPAAR
jgi:hypothetical protein